MELRYANLLDLEKIAITHASAFPNSITTRLGKKSIIAMLKWYLLESNKFLFYVKEGDEILGYCGGFVRDGRDIGSSTGMIQTGFKEVIMGVLKKPWLLFHPEVRNKYPFIYRNMVRKLKWKNKKQLMTNEKKIFVKKNSLTAGLVVIGVDPKYQKKGIGKFLLNEFESKTKSMGAEILDLSVKKENYIAIGSYNKNGYQIAKEDEKCFYMIKKI